MKSVELSNSIELSVLKSLYNEKSQMRLTGTDGDRVESLLEDFKARQNADVELLENPLNVWLITNESDDVVSIAIRDGNHRYKALVEFSNMGLKNTNIPINVQKTVTEFNGFNAVENFATNNALSWSEFDRANVAYRLSMGIDKNYTECEFTEIFPKNIKLEVKDGKTVITGVNLELSFEAKKVLIFNEKEDSVMECPLRIKNGKTLVEWGQILPKFYLVQKGLPTHIQVFGLSQKEEHFKSMTPIFKLVGFNSSQAAYTQTYLGRLDILYNFGTTELRSSESASEGVYKVLESIDYKSKLNTQLTRFNFLNALKNASKKEKAIIQSVTKVLTPHIYNSFLNLSGLRLNTKESPIFGKPLEVGGMVYHNIFKLAYMALYAKENNIESGTFSEIETTIRNAESARLAEAKAKAAEAAALLLKEANEKDARRIAEISALLVGKELSEVLSDEALKELHKEKQHLISKSTSPNKDGQGQGTVDSFEDKDGQGQGTVDRFKPFNVEEAQKWAFTNLSAFIAKNGLSNDFLDLCLIAVNDGKLSNISTRSAIVEALAALKK